MAQLSGARAGIFLQGFAIGGNGLFEPRRPTLPLAEAKERSAETHLDRGPIERKSAPGPELGEMAVPLDRRPGRRIIPEFIALPVESAGFFVKVFPTLVFMPLRHFLRRFGKALRRFGIAQPGQSHIAALGGGLRGVERETIQRFGLDFFDRGQNFVGLAEFAVLDRLLRVRFQRGDF